jgi:hypothetical protein
MLNLMNNYTIQLRIIFSSRPLYINLNTEILNLPGDWRVLSRLANFIYICLYSELKNIKH